MIDINQYRSQIGLFRQKLLCSNVLFKHQNNVFRKGKKIRPDMVGSKFTLKLVILLLLLEIKVLVV